MRSRTTAILLVLVLAFGTYAWLFESGTSSRQQEETGPAFPDFRAEEASGVVLVQGDSRISFEKSGGAWRMTGPLKSLASKALSDLLVELETLRTPPRLDGGKLGPVLTSVFVSRGDTQVAGLLLGEDTSDGQSAFACRAGQSEVRLLPKETADSLRKGLNDWRDKSLLDLRREKAVRFSLTYPDRRLLLEKGAGGWRMKEPLEAAAGTGEVEQALSALSISVDTFVSELVQDFSPYGLDKPRLEVRVWDDAEHEETPSGYAIGDKIPPKPFENFETRYARPLDGSSVMTVHLRRIEDLVREPRQFRSRRILDRDWDSVRSLRIETPAASWTFERSGSGWECLKPHRCTLEPEVWDRLMAGPLKALEASVIEPALPSTVQPCAGRMVLTLGDSGTLTLEMGRPDPQTHQIPLTLPGEGFLFWLPPSAGALLAPSLENLRTLSLLSVPLGSFHGIEVSCKGVTQAYEPARGWSRVHPERREGPLPGAAALALSLSTLRAERWVAIGGVHWQDYGLEPAAAEIRFRIAEGSAEPATRVLVLGRREGASVYARLDGTDELMLLPGSLLDRALSVEEDPEKALKP